MSKFRNNYIKGVLDDEVIFVTPHSALNNDWIRSARIMKKAEAGDLKAKKELKELENTGTMIFEED